MTPIYQTSITMHHHLSLLAKDDQSKPDTWSPVDLHGILLVYLCIHEEKAPDQMDG